MTEIEMPTDDNGKLSGNKTVIVPIKATEGLIVGNEYEMTFKIKVLRRTECAPDDGFTSDAIILLQSILK